MLEQEFTNLWSQMYLPLGELELEMEHPEGITNYRRQLDISTGVHTVEYDCHGVHYTRECFVSHPDQVMVTKISADQPETVTWRAKASWGRAPASYAIQRIVNRSEKTTFPHPKDWILESSPDGIVWEKMDERTGQTFTTLNEPPYLSEQFNYTYNAHVPYLFSAKNAAWTFTTFGTV